jgi:polysaccharide export outer membrane protein
MLRSNKMTLKRRFNFYMKSLVLVLMMVLCGCGSTQKFAEIPTTVPSDVQKRLEYLNSTYKLDPPDTLAIRVKDNPDLDTQVIVRPDGNISFPLLGDVYVAGHSPLEIREKLWKLLGTYIRELPLEAIEVQVVGFNSKKLFVYSEKIGIREIPYTGGTTLLSAISQSGLLRSTADLKDIKVVRATNEERNEPQRLVVNLDDILKEGKGNMNIVLRENDVVYIPNKLLAKIGYALNEVLFPMGGVRGVGGFTEAAMFNVWGFAGPPSGWQGWMGQAAKDSGGSTGFSSRSGSTSPVSPFSIPGVSP